VINEVTNWDQRTLYKDRLQWINVHSGCRRCRAGAGGSLECWGRLNWWKDSEEGRMTLFGDDGLM
jgi:hypothetical protein